MILCIIFRAHSGKNLKIHKSSIHYDIELWVRMALPPHAKIAQTFHIGDRKAQKRDKILFFVFNFHFLQFSLENARKRVGQIFLFRHRSNF